MDPEPDATGVATDAWVTVEFSEGVSGVDVTTLRVSELASPAPVTTSVFYDVHDNAATLVPLQQLREGTSYEVSVGPGIVDYAGQPLEPATWTFTTLADQGPPTILVMVPADGDTGVRITAPSIFVGFSEPMVGISPASFYLTDATGVVPATLRIDPVNRVHLTTGTLAPHTTYTLHLTEAITDTSGNPLVGAPLAFTFTTGDDIVPPTIVAQTPAPNDTQVPLTTWISVRFSEPMIGASASTLLLEHAGTPVEGTIAYFAGAMVARLTPDAPLLPNATYVVKLTPGLTDTAGNPVSSGTVVWAFTTGP